MVSKILVPALIILLSAAAAFWMANQETEPELVKPEPPSMLVDVMRARANQVQISIEAQGSVTPRTQTVLVSEVSGLIMEVSPAFVAGGFFKKGDVLVQIDDRNYRADVKRAQASVATAQTLVTRERGLADYAESDWERAKPSLSTSRAASDLALRKPQLAEAIANLEFAEAELAKRLGDLDRTIIRAPYDGLVREKRADVGQFVAAGTQLALTFATDVAEIRLPLPDLKPWYQQLCKRPCFHDEYLQSYNEPGCTLLDTDGKGVERITENGVVVDGKEYEVDCIIYASGFEVGTPFERRSGYDTKGRDGLLLSDYWEKGMRTMHGAHVHGFPNLFIVQATQGANLISNYPHNLTESGTTVALMIKHAIDNGFSEIEVKKEAEDAWIKLLMSAPPRMIGSTNCTPGYYNNEGKGWGDGADGSIIAASSYPAGATAYFEYLKKWRSSGEFEGIEFS